jgi:glutathione S-transferase
MAGTAVSIEALGTMKLYAHFSSIPSGRALLMLSMAGIDFDYVDVDVLSQKNQLPHFRALTPFAQVPVLDDNGVFVCQSPVILTYLAEKTGRFAGVDLAEGREIQSWLFCDADMGGSLRITRSFTVIFPGVDPVVLAFHTERARRLLAMLDAHLGRRDFLVGGRPTIADISFFPLVGSAPEGGLPLDPYPHIEAWRARLMSLPGCLPHYELMARYTTVDMSAFPATAQREESR